MITHILDIHNSSFNIHSLPPLIAGLAIIALGLFAFIRERASFLGAAFLLLCASIGLFYSSAGMNYAHQSPETALFWTRVGHIGVICIPFGILLLDAARFGLSRGERYAIAGSGVLTVVFYFFLFSTNLYITRIDHYYWGHYAQFGPLGVLFIVYFALTMFYALRRDRKEARHGATARSRRRSNWLFVAFCGGSLGGLDFLPALGVPVYPFGYVPILFFIIMGAYVLARYRLKDITPEIAVEQILETMQGAVIVTDAGGKIRVVNRAARIMLEYEQAELIGRDFSSFRLAPDEVSDAVRSDAPVITRELTWHSRGGKLYYVTVAVSAIRDTLDNSPAGIVYLINDITAHKRFEEKLEEERLKTQKLEAVGTLAGGIAHDFNNLLQSVFGYITLAKMSNDTQGCISALEEAEKAITMSVQLTNQLLTFSKGGKPVKKTVSLPPLIDRAAKFALSGSHTNYRMKSDDGLWKADADEGQISQVIQNVVLNADQAMPDAGVVEIAARNVRIPGPRLPHILKHGPYVEISITDSGIGIPEKYINKIFDPYFTTKAKGSGLGLATSYSIIRNHNGAIDVASMEGAGTAFRIYLPAATAAADESRPMPASAGTGRRARVLVMDDEAAVLKVAGALLKALGHDADYARHGAEALEKYEDARRTGRPFDVVIVDLTIRGGMGGVDTITRLRELDPRVTAIVSSGYSDDAAIANYEKHGFKAALGKPYDIEQLQQTLNQVLNG